MVTLEERVEIPAPFEKLLWWVDHFEEEFVKWSPYHLSCELYDGGVRVGDRVRFYEFVCGCDYDVTGRITRAERDKDHFCFLFESDRRTAWITFEDERTENGCRFLHTETFGLKTPVVGPIVNFVIFRILYRKQCRWEVIREDMQLDNRLLSDILTKGKYPERIPEELLQMGKKLAEDGKTMPNS